MAENGFAATHTVWIRDRSYRIRSFRSSRSAVLSLKVYRRRKNIKNNQKSAVSEILALGVEVTCFSSGAESSAPCLPPPGHKVPRPTFRQTILQDLSVGAF